jgi:hypothetical protein
LLRSLEAGFLTMQMLVIGAIPHAKIVLTNNKSFSNELQLKGIHAFWSSENRRNALAEVGEVKSAAKLAQLV